MIYSIRKHDAHVKALNSPIEFMQVLLLSVTGRNAKLLDGTIA